MTHEEEGILPNHTFTFGEDELAALREHRFLIDADADPAVVLAAGYVNALIVSENSGDDFGFTHTYCTLRYREPKAVRDLVRMDPRAQALLSDHELDALV